MNEEKKFSQTEKDIAWALLLLIDQGEEDVKAGRLHEQDEVFADLECSLKKRCRRPQRD